MKRKAFKSWLEVGGKVASKHRQHIIAASFICQQDSSAVDDIVQSEALRIESHSNAKVTGGGSKGKVLHAHGYGIQASTEGAIHSNNKRGYERMGSPEKARMLERVRGCTKCTSWKHTAEVCQQRWMLCVNGQAGQWVLLGGSSTEAVHSLR